MSKQNLDNFFKNTFENFEEFPPEIVWGNIEAQLSKKKKRRVVPFWWKHSGVAALLLISFGVYNFYFNDSVTQKTNAIEVVTKEKEKTTISKTPALVKTIHKSNIQNTNNTQIVNHADKTENNKTNSANNSFNENHNNLYAASNG
jgi:cytoskeletal protein RodZ